MIRLRASLALALRRRILGPVAILSLALVIGLFVTHAAVDAPLSSVLVVCIAVAMAAVTVRRPCRPQAGRVVRGTVVVTMPHVRPTLAGAILFVPLRL